VIRPATSHRPRPSSIGALKRRPWGFASSWVKRAARHIRRSPNIMNSARRSGSKAILSNTGQVESAVMSLFCGDSCGGSWLHSRLERDFFFSRKLA